MDHSSSKPKTVRHRTALVQGESFRCVAIEIKPGRWKNVQDGTELPRVLEILQVIDDGGSKPLIQPEN
jgi:hypothetical protein